MQFQKKKIVIIMETEHILSCNTAPAVLGYYGNRPLLYDLYVSSMVISHQSVLRAFVLMGLMTRVSTGSVPAASFSSISSRADSLVQFSIDFAPVAKACVQPLLLFDTTEPSCVLARSINWHFCEKECI